ncbi:homeobox protein vex1-like [Gastrophryne carolinensis]
MEKRAYSVEWLSESSHRNTTYPTMDLLTCTLGYHKELGAMGLDRTSSAIDLNEKENLMEPRAALYQTQSTHPPTQDVTTSRKAFKASSQNTISAPEKYPSSGSESPRSPGSLSEEEGGSRPRTKFTNEQLQELEKSFKEHRYIGSSEKKRLSKVLKLSETQIKTWFQNRRMKFKRQSQDARVEAFFSGFYLPYYSYSDFQAPALPIRPEVSMPLGPAAAPHSFPPLPTTVVRPGIHPAAIPHSSPYPCPSMLVHPMLSEPIGQRYSPY